MEQVQDYVNQSVNEAMQAHQQQLNEIMHLLQNISMSQTAIPTQAQSQSPNIAATTYHTDSIPRSGRHFMKPPEYDGKNRTYCSTFISHLNLYIKGNPAEFPDDTSKVTFAASYLRDAAFRWFEPHLLQEHSQLLYDYNLFLEELERNIGDPDKGRTIIRAIRSLSQTSSASAYTSEFTRLSAYLSDWGEQALMSQYYDGLKDDVKNAMAFADRDFESVAEMSNFAIRMDNRIYERRLDSRRSQTSNRPSQTHSKPSQTQHRQSQPPPRNPASGQYQARSNPVSSSSSTDMDLDAARNKRFQPLTEVERQRRMQQRLCLYCAESGHILANCPHRKGHKQNTRRLNGTFEDEENILDFISIGDGVLYDDEEYIHSENEQGQL